MAIARPNPIRHRPIRHRAAGAPSTDPRVRWRRVMTFVLPVITLLPLLFVPQLGGMGPLLFLLALALCLFPVPLSSAGQIARAGPILLIPAFTALSAAWSTVPATTLWQSFQLAVTLLAGVLIGTSRRPDRTLAGVFVTFAFYAVASIAFGGSVALGPAQDTAFAGLNGGKNYLADIVAIGFLAGVACTIVALRDRRLMLAAVAFCATLIPAYILAIARSSGAILGTTLALTLFGGLLFFKRAPGGMKILLAALLLTGTIGMSFTIAVEGKELREDLLAVMGKNDSLTGRVYLWHRAEAIMREQPLLGAGYGGFWVQGQQDAEGLWAYSQIRNRMGFNFHNTQIEQRVNLGWIGYLLIAAITLSCTLLLIVGSVGRASVAAVFWTSFMIYELSRVSYEAIGPAAFNHGSVMMAAAMSFGITTFASRDRTAEDAPSRDGS